MLTGLLTPFMQRADAHTFNIPSITGDQEILYASCPYMLNMFCELCPFLNPPAQLQDGILDLRDGCWRLRLDRRKRKCVPTPNTTAEFRDVFIATHLMKMPKGRDHKNELVANR